MAEFITAAWDWSDSHRWAVWAIVALSAGSIVVSGLLIGAVLLRLPPDHYSRTRPSGGRSAFTDANGSWLAGGLWFVVRNIVGWVLILAGVAMLVLPGQGVLAILAGLVLVDFPGKLRFERRLLANHTVRNAMNWLRRRAGRPPLDFT